MFFKFKEKIAKRNESFFLNEETKFKVLIRCLKHETIEVELTSVTTHNYVKYTCKCGEVLKLAPVDFMYKSDSLQFPNSKNISEHAVYAVDGVKKLSNHQDEADSKKDNLGSAVDLYPFFLGQVQVNHKDTVKNLKLIAAHIKKVAAELKIGITWGGDWKNPYDPPHFELKRK